jgi:arylsulfatase A-like enzyme
MDFFPTAIEAAGGAPSVHELDGRSLLPCVCAGNVPETRDIFWEMGCQTAVRRGPWKLVLNGQLVEGTTPEDAIHLSNLDEDAGERVNLATQLPALAEYLKTAALNRRAGIEKRWETEFAPAEPS